MALSDTIGKKKLLCTYRIAAKIEKKMGYDLLLFKGFSMRHALYYVHLCLLLDNGHMCISIIYMYTSHI